MEYFSKYEKNPYEDIRWNIPERRQGVVAVVGGNGQAFRVPVKIAEWLTAHYPLETVKVLLPDVLQDKLPPVPDFVFVSSTESGSFADAEEIASALEVTDYGLVVGDLSKNAITAKALAAACHLATKPLLITRDAIDLLMSESADNLLMNQNLILVATLAQLQKLLKTVYYPKILTMTQPLTMVAEVLHKFTLSYPVKVVTLHDGQVLIAENGSVAAVPLDQSGFSPLTLWSGEFAAKIAAYNLYNPDNFVKASVCATFA